MQGERRWSARGIEKGSDGVIKGSYNGSERVLDENDIVSMSMWGFGADFMPKLEKRLVEFLSSLDADEPKAELTIADAVDSEIHENGYKVRNLSTDSRWFGITYEQDVELAKELLKKAVDDGIYSDPLMQG